MSKRVTLRGGPHDGQVVPADGRSTLVLFDTEPVPGAECFKYRPSREKGVYTYRGKDRLVGTLPEPGSRAPATNDARATANRSGVGEHGVHRALAR